MRVAFIVRSTFFTSKGGDTLQALNTARRLSYLGVNADIKLTHEDINYDQYDLLHFFNITRPADILYHINKTDKPFVLSPILVDYSEYDKNHRHGMARVLFSYLSASRIEYVKTVGRWLLRKDKLMGKSYLWKGHKKSIREILKRADFVLPNSGLEYQQLVKSYHCEPSYMIVPNGVNEELFTCNDNIEKDPNLILCVARIEGIKNQVNLIKALNNTPYKVIMIGAAAPNQSAYYKRCREMAAENISFVDHLPQEQLVPYYQRAKVHILPSWFETCGLSTLEAIAAGCNVVVTSKGYTEEYYGKHAFYCDPASPNSIRKAVEQAIASDHSEKFIKKISTHYTWSQAAERTFEAYGEVLKKTGKLRIGILGTRGIPNHYGGFEQFAEHLSHGLAEKGHEIIVYNSHDHPYQQKTWKNVQIEHCKNPEKIFGSFGQFIYDLNCILDARKKNLDVILMLGYTSNSIWGRLFPKMSTVIFNMDGLEWKRTKYSKPVQRFLRYAEKLAMKFGDHHIADSKVIRSYLTEKYQSYCEYIPYGAEVLDNEDESLLKEYDVCRNNYFLLIARMEPENNIEMILDGFSESMSTKKFLVVGDTRNKHGRYLLKKFEKFEQIQFIGPVYNNMQKIHTLRAFSYAYFHGHTVGGTNPSLLEAMASRSLIAAHDNPFNKAVLQTDAFYFSNAADVTNIVEKISRNHIAATMIKNNLKKIKEEYHWEKIIDAYHAMILKSLDIKPASPTQTQIEKVVA